MTIVVGIGCFILGGMCGIGAMCLVIAGREREDE